MAMGGKVALMVLLCFMVASSPPYTAEGAMTCQMVVNSLTPCASYLTGGGPKPTPYNTKGGPEPPTYITIGGPVPPSCCSGITSLYKAATTTVDRQTACRCLKQAAGTISGINLQNAGSLPGKCGVNIPYKISPTTDCSKVQ
ncbi:hypothetical protein L6452_41863 [Arctium lappa]|uniref:Uncharacterized protein n=1 Tax=Arctium lappa TaxID=4217 RepID=A0ACB8XIG1_ARCLA|nr:hypothetical protein L6452_41863 [Arctium lappa]